MSRVSVATARVDPLERRRKIAAIHAAAAKLGMDTADKNPGSEYRKMLQSIGGETSAADLSADGLRKVLRHLMRAQGLPEQPRGPAGLIARLWRELHAAGAIDDPSDAAQVTFVKRMTGVEHAKWLDGRQANIVIEALKAMRARAQA